MRRVLIKRGNVKIYSYPVMLYLGLVLGLLAQYYAADRIQLSPTRTIVATLVLLVPTLVGARLLFVFAHWNVYRLKPQRIWRSAEGGLAMYGGLILAVLLSIPLLAILEISWGAFWDVASFTILIAILVTRVGCFLNGCCCGRPTSNRFAFYLPDQHGVWQRRIPTQLLEATWVIIVLIGAINIWESLVAPGALFLYTLGAYGAGRFVIESMLQEQDFVFGLPFSQILSLVLMIVSLMGLATSSWR